MEYNRLERFELWLGRNWTRTVLLLIVLFVSIVGIPIINSPQNVNADEFQPYEITDNRTETGKIYQIGQDKYSLDVSISPIHYWANNQWFDIDPDYYEDDTSQGYSAIFLKTPFIVRMADDSGRRIYPDRGDLSYWIHFYKPFPNMGTPEKAGGYWYWNFDHAVIAVKICNTSVKFAFRLKDSQAPSSITIPFETQGITREGNLLYHDGKVIGMLRKPFAIDANGIERDCSVEFGTNEVTISLDTSGLAYPIDIDPTVEVDVDSSADDAHERGNGDFDSAASTVRIYSNTTADDVMNGGYCFDNITIPNGATIDVAYAQIYIYSASYDDAYCTIYMNDVDDANDFVAEDDIVGRDFTTGVSWIQDSLGTGHISTPSLVDDIQEVVDRVGWVSGNSMAVLFIGTTDDNKSIRTYAFDYGDAVSKLHIEYTAAGGPDPPTVTTNNPNAVCETSANVSGNITANGGEDAYWAGFYYDDDGTPYANEQGSSGTFGVGEFTENITGLSPGTKYHYIASANNTGGQGSGSEVTLITLPTGPTDMSSLETGNSTANLTWSAVAGGGVDRYEIRRVAGNTPPSDNTSGTLVYNSNGTSTQDTGLTPGTQYSYSLFTIAEDDGLESCSANYTTVTIWTHPGDVYGVSTSNIQQTQFQVDWNKGQNSENTTWRYQEGSYPTGPNDGNPGYNGTGTSCNITGLDADTSYYLGGWGYDVDSGLWSVNGYFFIQATSANITPPTVETDDATDTEETTVTINGDVTDTGGEDVTRHFYWDTDLSAPFSDNWTDAGVHSAGPYSHGLTGLNKGDKYVFMASANNTAGTGNGTLKYFMTKPDEPTSGNATGGTGNITLAWTPGDGNDNSIVYGKQGGYPSAIGDGTLVYNGSANTTIHTGLGNNETWYYRAWSSATENATTTYSDTYTQMTDTTLTLAPSMQTDAATGVGYTDATLNGQVVDNGGEDPDVYFFYGTADGGTDPASWSDNVSKGSQGGSFNSYVSGLPNGVTIYFTVRGINSGGTGWGTTLNFTTTNYTAPTISNNGASGITDHDATLNGNLTDDGGTSCNITWYWDTSNHGQSDTWPNSANYSGKTTGVTYHSITGTLSESTTYFFIIKAVNVAGTGWSTTANFTTTANATNPCSNLTLTDLGFTTVTASWTPGSGNYTMLRGMRNDTPTSVTDGELLYYGTGSSVDLTGLQLDINEYVVAAWSFAADNITYSNAVTASIGGESMEEIAEAIGGLNTALGNIPFSMLISGALTISIVAIALWQKNIILYLIAGFTAILVPVTWIDDYLAVTLLMMFLGLYLFLEAILMIFDDGSGSRGWSQFRNYFNKVFHR